MEGKPRTVSLRQGDQAPGFFSRSESVLGSYLGQITSTAGSAGRMILLQKQWGLLLGGNQTYFLSKWPFSCS